MSKNPPFPPSLLRSYGRASGQNLSARVARSKNLSDTVLFYTDVPRTFRSTLIGYLYEIARVFPVVLLAEEIDKETEKILLDKTFFPGLKEMIPIGQYSGTQGLRARHKRLFRLAKEAVKRHNPRIIIATGTYPFESYLRRLGKTNGATTISGIGPIYGRTRERRAYHTLFSSYGKVPVSLPFFAKSAFIMLRKYAAHLLYYWILPLSVGQRPFVTGPSFPFISRYGRYKTGADYYIVMLAGDREALVKEGIPRKKFLFVAHPLEGSSRTFLEKTYFASAKTHVAAVKNHAAKNVLIVWPDVKMGFQKDTYAVIPQATIQKDRENILRIILSCLPGWEISIKPHPTMTNIMPLKRMGKALSPLIRVTNPSDRVEDYIEASGCIIGVSPISTALYTASLQCPQKPILSLDLQKELMGDSFEGIEGIEYIDNEQRFRAILTTVEKGSYKKSPPVQAKEKFAGIVDAIESVKRS